MVHESFDGEDQIAIGVGLHDVAADSGFDDFANQLVGEVKRENNDFGFWLNFADLASGFETVQLGHADVHDNDVRLQLFNERNGFTAGFRLGANFPASVRGEELFETAPYNVVIVGN
jgi:hypothetical protein